MRIPSSGLIAFFLLALLPNRGVADDGHTRIATVLIKGGDFTMGTPIRRKRDPEYHSDESPVNVVVKAFRIGKYPVTAKQKCAFLNSTFASAYNRETLYNHRDIGTHRYSTIALNDDGVYVPRNKAADAPANQVTWKGAVLFCKWLSDSTDKTFRLPTEAEWEFAARGEKLRKWPWGDAPPTAMHGLRYDYDAFPLNSAILADRIARNQPTWTTAAVGSYPDNATPEGVRDMLGYLIGEWCANKYTEDPTPQQMVDTDCDLDDLTTHRVVRGYYHRAHSRGPLLPFSPWPRHGGRTWTRVKAHPIDAAKQAARHGFRVVEGIDSLNN